MSGGFFEHQDYLLDSFADSINEIIYKNDSKEQDKYGQEIGRGYSAKTIEKFKATVEELTRLGKKLHRIDWLLSGDDGQATFHERWENNGL